MLKRKKEKQKNNERKERRQAPSCNIWNLKKKATGDQNSENNWPWMA